MKKLLTLIALLPSLAMAENKLPLNEPGELCYIRVYSKEHLAKNPRQEITAAAVTITIEDGDFGLYIEVKTRKGKTMANGGGLITMANSGGLITKQPREQPKLSVKGYLDDDGGSVLLSQSQRNENVILLKVLTSLHLEEDNYTTNDQIPEGTPFESMNINPRSTDSIWMLERVRVNGSTGKTCSQVLEDRT